ncbi:D-alanyl-D-alanine carboxypeptidase [bacterium]|nr:D-alanyl-D-alanine carboxypeptidase [candidate division CSSED10-310 bacterium]
MKYPGSKIFFLILMAVFNCFVCMGEDGPGDISRDMPSIQSPDCKSAVVMEVSTGDIAYELNPHLPLPPASMVKMMVIYITMEKIREGSLRLTDSVTTSANASKMGGSQVYLKHGEQFTIDELIQAVMVQSANDASMVLAEYIGGSAKGFVDMMNAKARELGMNDTVFRTPHGLPPGNNQEPDLISAMDLAVLGRALVLRYPELLKWSRMETKEFRDGKFIMTNTNQLVKSFNGCDGIKTGYYREAGFGITATAERGGVRIIAVVMGCEKGKVRFSEAARLLSFGFDQYRLVNVAESGHAIDTPVPVVSGEKKEIHPEISGDLNVVIRKSNPEDITRHVELIPNLKAPVKSGTECGSVMFLIGDRELGELPLVISEDIPELSWWGKFLRMLGIS